MLDWGCYRNSQLKGLEQQQSNSIRNTTEPNLLGLTALASGAFLLLGFYSLV